MKHYKTVAITFAFIISLALVGSVVFAQSTGTDNDSPRRRGDRAEMSARGKHHKRGGQRSGRLMKQLDLTDAQRAQMKQIRENHRESLRAIHNQIRAVKQELRQANPGNEFNEALASRKLAEIAPLKAKLMAARHRMHQEELSVLTPEQRTRLEQMREQFKSRRSERRARRG